MSLPNYVFTSAQIRQIESDHARSHNGHCYDLMELAGRKAFEILSSMCGNLKDVWVFAGRGNNGGDGYVVASCLKQANIPHRVFAVGAPHEGSEAHLAYEYYLSQGGKVEMAYPPALTEENTPSAIVDALLGTGISSAPASPVDELISYINKARVFTLSIDIPSGASADTGEVPGSCVNADVTVCMLALKPGLLTGDAVDYVGKVVFADLGIDLNEYLKSDAAIDGAPVLPIVNRNYDDIKDSLPQRVRSSNKGDNGKVLIIAGAKGMGGAAILCGSGALRSGAGLVKVALDPLNIAALNAVRPELMSVDYDDEDLLDQALDWADVVALGPGLGQSLKARQIVLKVSALDKLTVFDADALNILASSEPVYSPNRVITPHPGEAARLLHLSIEEICRDRFESAFRLQSIYGGIVLLKGAGTVICDGRKLSIISEGSPAMATGGMGDLLTGIIASLLAQGLSPNLAAVSAACIHGRAGYLSGLNQGEIGTLPLDLCSYVRRLINGRA